MRNRTRATLAGLGLLLLAAYLLVFLHYRHKNREQIDHALSRRTGYCVFDNAAIAGDYVQLSTEGTGLCHDVGPNPPMNRRWIIGQVLGGGPAGTHAIETYMAIPELRQDREALAISQAYGDLSRVEVAMEHLRETRRRCMIVTLVAILALMATTIAAWLLRGGKRINHG